MKHRTIILTILATVFLASTAHAGGIHWRTNWKAAQAESKRTGKPLMIDMSVDWCGWCTTLDEQVYPNPDVIRASESFVPVRFNAEEDGRDIAAAYGVRAYPTILFIDTSARVIYRIEGFEPPDQFAAELNRVAGSNPEMHLMQPARKEKTFSEAPLIKTHDPVLLAQDMVRHQRFEEAEMLVESLELAKDNARMGPLYDSMGDAALARKQALVASHWFEKTIQFVKDPDMLGYAHLQLARCYLALNEVTKAQSELKSAIKVKGISPHVLNAANKVLGTIVSG